MFLLLAVATMAASIALFRKSSRWKAEDKRNGRSSDLEEDTDMTFVGLAVAFLGFVIAFVQPWRHREHRWRGWALVLAGIVVTLVGIMGVIVPAYQKTWIWKR